jgi:hypothetical protein
MTPDIKKIIDQYSNTALSWKLSGAAAAATSSSSARTRSPPNAFRIKIRIKDFWL